LLGVAQLERRERAGIGVDLQEGDVRRPVGAYDLGLHALLVREADLDVARAGDDVVVRDDVAGLVDHESGALRLLLLARERKPEQRLHLLWAEAGRRDLHDSRGRPPVDLADGQRPRGALEEGRLLAGHRAWLGEDRGRRVFVDDHAEHGSAAECDGATCHSCDRECGRQMESGERNSHLYPILIPGLPLIPCCSALSACRNR
jgi:hypothetical protein